MSLFQCWPLTTSKFMMIKQVLCKFSLPQMFELLLSLSTRFILVKCTIQPQVELQRRNYEHDSCAVTALHKWEAAIVNKSETKAPKSVLTIFSCRDNRFTSSGGNIQQIREPWQGKTSDVEPKGETKWRMLQRLLVLFRWPVASACTKNKPWRFQRWNAMQTM